MKEETIEAVQDAIEGLIAFISAPKPTDTERDKALTALVSLRNQLELEDISK